MDMNSDKMECGNYRVNSRPAAEISGEWPHKPKGSGEPKLRKKVRMTEKGRKVSYLELPLKGKGNKPIYSFRLHTKLLLIGPLIV